MQKVQVFDLIKAGLHCAGNRIGAQTMSHRLLTDLMRLSDGHGQLGDAI